MTVSELIELLEDYPDNMPVYVGHFQIDPRQVFKSVIGYAGEDGLEKTDILMIEIDHIVERGDQ